MIQSNQKVNETHRKDVRYPKRHEAFWINTGAFYKKLYVFYESSVLDLTNFLSTHPGGQKAIKNYKFYPHNPSIIEKLMKYKIGQRTLSNSKQKQKQLSMLKNQRPTKDKSLLKTSFLINNKQIIDLKSITQNNKTNLTQSDTQKSQKRNLRQEKSLNQAKNNQKSKNANQFKNCEKKQKQELQEGQQNLRCSSSQIIQKQNSIRCYYSPKFLKDITN